MLRHLPNLITLFRLALIPPFVYLLLQQNYLAAFVLYFLAGLTDGIDGFLARRFAWTSKLGAIMDPLADKLLMFSTYLSLSYLGQIPWWLSFIVIGRDVCIILGVGSAITLFGEVKLAPTIISKINTMFTGLLALLVLFQLAFWPLPAIIYDSFVAVVLITTFWSFFGYVFLWIRRAMQGPK